VFDKQVASSRSSGERLGVAKSANESWTRIAIYVSLFVLYVVGGGEVKSVSDAWSPRRVVTHEDLHFCDNLPSGPRCLKKLISVTLDPGYTLLNS
jgi:hypothetical protein